MKTPYQVWREKLAVAQTSAFADRLAVVKLYRNGPVGLWMWWYLRETLGGPDPRRVSTFYKSSASTSSST